jgi:LPXTG-site transpeptidase (sortase) family protein
MAETNKIYPQASQEMAKLLGMEKQEQATTNIAGPFPADLPIIDVEVTDSVVSEGKHDSIKDSPEKLAAELDAEQEAEAKQSGQGLKIVKAVGPYLVLFVLGIFLYYFFFSTFSFQTLLKNNSISTPVEEKSTALEDLKKNNLADFQKWMKRFYFDVSDNSIIDPDHDNSGNGLTNFEKYILNLNPKTYSTPGTGVPDGQLVIEGIDPTTNRSFSEAKLKTVQTYLDLEVISNRLTASSFNKANGRVEPVPQVAPGTDFRGSAPATPNYNDGGAGVNSLINQQSQPPVNSSVRTQPTISTGSTKVAQASSPEPYEGENRLNIDTSKPARLEIPSLNVSVPLIWTKYTKNFDKDLRKGVVHFPGTALPGDIGTSYISGHSSNYSFVKSDYNYVFAKLDQLKELSSFKITVYLKSGKTATLHYVVQKSKIFKPDDQEQFINTAESVVALSTCWPPGTTADRLVVFGKLSQTEM